MNTVYTANGDISVNNLDVEVVIQYAIEHDAVLLRCVTVDGSAANWLMDVFERELTAICADDFECRAEEWARDAAEDMAELRHDARMEAMGL